MTSTDRTRYRETVALVAEKAKARLPEQVNGRIESAVKLVLVHDVTPQADGSILVGSSSDALKTYRLVGSTCECQDFTRGQAPDGWCQHRIAAGLHKRVQELLAAPVPVDPEILEPFPDNDDEPEESAAPVPCPAPLPEAPCSCNVYVSISGHKVQVTLRDHDEQRMLTRLQTILERYPVPQAPASAQPQGTNQLTPQQHHAAVMHRTVTDFCPVHNVAMQLNTKDGRSWWSHKTDQGWCKGK
jgi:hypothetical protein